MEVWCFAENRDDTHHLRPSDGFADSALTFKGEACDVSTVDFAHVRKVFGENGRVLRLGYRVDVKLMEDIVVARFSGRGADGSPSGKWTGGLDARLVSELVGSHDLLLHYYQPKEWKRKEPTRPGTKGFHARGCARCGCSRENDERYV